MVYHTLIHFTTLQEVKQKLQLVNVRYKILNNYMISIKRGCPYTILQYYYYAMYNNKNVFSSIIEL